MNKALLTLACLTWLLPVNPASALSLTRGPYLHQSTPTSIIMVWQTDDTSNSKIVLSDSPGADGQAYVSHSQSTLHALQLSDLLPGRRYYYTVGSTTTTVAGGDASTFFETAPPVGSPASTRLWVVGDSGTGGTSQRQVRDAMHNAVGERSPDLFIHVGDMAYSDGEDHEFQANFFDVYAETLRHSVIWPALGNHEGRTSNSANQSGPYFNSYFLPSGGEAGGVPSGTEAYYSFDYANIHFVVLDSHQSSRATDGAMLTWLAQDLDSTDQDWLIAFWHHPPYSMGSHHSDQERRLIQMRERALPLLEAAGVDLVLSGHSHIYERSHLLNGAYDTPTTAWGHLRDNGDGDRDGPYQKGPEGQGAVYVVAGHGGAGLYQEGVHPVMAFTEVVHGSCIVDVQGQSLVLYNLRKDGQISDTFTLTRGEALAVTSPAPNSEVLTGTTQWIEWTSTGSPAPVNLFLSVEGGPFEPLAMDVFDTRFAWQVPHRPTDDAVIRVASTQDRDLFGETSFTITDQETINLVPFGASWRYHDRGQPLDTEWVQPSYDDSPWQRGAGQLGFGDGDEATSLSPPEGTPTVYFRKTINLDALPTTATLQVIHDDGVTVWVNGYEVLSRYMNNGLHYGAWASEVADDNELSVTRLTLDSFNPFVAGPNTLAVMLKQVGPTSSDLSFDLQLSIQRPHAMGTSPEPLETPETAPQTPETPEAPEPTEAPETSPQTPASPQAPETTPQAPTHPTGVPPLEPEPTPQSPWGCQAFTGTSHSLVLLLIALCFRRRRHAWFNESATP